MKVTVQTTQMFQVYTWKRAETVQVKLFKQITVKTNKLIKLMKNLIVSLEKLPMEVKSHLEKEYPHGYYHETFEFEIPGKNEIYEALRTTYNGITYMIKVGARKKKIDMNLDGF